MRDDSFGVDTQQRMDRPVEVSIVVPVYNGADRIERCVASLKRQKTRRVFEIVIIDDGSTDESLKRVAGSNVRVIRQPNRGPAAARNLGVEAARGELILFTDSDCEPLEDWLEEMVRPLGNSGISGVKGRYLTSQEKILPLFVQMEYETKYERMRRESTIDFIDTYSAGFIKKDFLAVGKYDTTFPAPSVEDQEFSFRMWERGYKMIFNPNAKVYHTHPESLWHYMKKKFRIGFWKVLVLRKHPRKILRDSHTPQSLKFEMVLLVLWVSMLFLSLFEPGCLRYAFLPLVGFVSIVCPFAVKSFRRSWLVALCSPFLLFVRALCLSLGLMVGSLSLWARRKREFVEIRRESN